MKIFGKIFGAPADFVVTAPVAPEIIQSGICEQGGYLHLVHPEMYGRGIKLVSVPSDLQKRFDRVRKEWNAVQFELSKCPTSLRPRKPRPVVSKEKSE